MSVTYLYVSGNSDTYPIGCYSMDSENALSNFQGVFANPSGDFLGYGALLCVCGSALFAVNLAGDDLRYFSIQSDGKLKPISKRTGYKSVSSMAVNSDYLYVMSDELAFHVLGYDHDALFYIKTVAPISQYISNPVAAAFKIAPTSKYLVGWVQDNGAPPSKWIAQCYLPNQSDLDLVSECPLQIGQIIDVVHNTALDNENVYFCYDKGICRCSMSDGTLDSDVDVTDSSLVVTGTFCALCLSADQQFLYALERTSMPIVEDGGSDGYGCYVHTYAINSVTGQLEYSGKSDAAYDAVTFIMSPDGKCIYLPATDMSAISTCTVGDDEIANNVNQDQAPDLNICVMSLAIVTTPS